MIRDGLARAHQAAGNVDEAIAEYNRLSTFDPTGKDRLLIHPKYHYRLGKLHQENGRPDLALEEFEKFPQFWQEADEGLPEVVDCRRRLSE